MSFLIDPEFRDHLTPLTDDEFEGLAARICQEGCQPGALVVGILKGERYLIDGHNTLKICEREEIKPPTPREFHFESREEILEWIGEHQHSRRNLSVEAKHAERVKRRDRVMAMRQAGESNRAIAEKENISEKTVRHDVAVSSAPPSAPRNDDTSRQGADPSAPSKVPDTPKVTGKDGKQYPAAKQKILCVHCQTLVRKSLALPTRCEECSELNRTKRSGQTTRPPRPRKNGQILPDYKKEFEAHYGPLVRIFDAMRKELDCRETGPFQGALRCESGLLENFKEANKLVLSKRQTMRELQ